MRVTRTHLLLLPVLSLSLPVACKSPAGSGQAPVSPPERVTLTEPASTGIEGPPQPTAADEIAARARQDLLESMAIGAVERTSSPAPRSTPAQTVVTWKDPSTIKPPSAPEPASPQGMPPASSMPKTALPAHDSQPDIDELTQTLARALHDRSHDGDKPMRDLTVLAALAMLDAGNTLDSQTIQTLTEDERITLQGLQDWFLAMESGMDDRTAILETVLESVRGLQASLRRTPRFELSDTSLVTRVGGFGDIDEWTLRNDEEQYNFIAHSGQEIILYLELDGFESRLDDTGRWETSTSQQLVIYSDRDGIPVWKEQWQTATDLAGSRRNDYFTAQKIAIPTNLSVGKYQLKVRVRDEFSQSESEATIPFVMTAAVLAP